MALTYKTPGVHIVEVTPAGPIEAVGTSTAAFIGPAVAGPMFKPTKIANWNSFVEKFGNEITVNGREEMSPYSFYPKILCMPMAVRGFFNNGGQIAYIVRVGTGVHAYRELDDRISSANKALRIEAKEQGTIGNQRSITVQHQHLQESEIAGAKTTIIEAGIRSQIVKAEAGSKEVILQNSDEAKKFRTGLTIKLTDSLNVKSEKAIILSIQKEKITLDRKLSHEYSGGIIWASSNAAKVRDESEFRAGDTVFIYSEGGPPPTPPPTPAPETETIPKAKLVIARVVESTLIFTTNLEDDYTDGEIAIPNLKVGEIKFRVKDARKLERGSVIKISHNGKEEYGEVANTQLLPPEIDSSRHGFITLKKGLKNAYDLYDIDSPAIESQEFKLVIKGQGGTETFEGLSMSKDHSGYYENAVNSKLVNVLTPDEPSVAPPPNNQPAEVNNLSLEKGQNDNVKELDAPHFIEGINKLEQIDDVNILCVPDAADNASLQVSVQSALISHCEKMKDRFAILDPVDKTAESESLASKDPLDDTGILAQRLSVASADGRAALYYPRIKIQNPVPNGQAHIAVPPSGHIAGIYAKVDGERGVHKAPANVKIEGALGLALKDGRKITDAEQGELNVQGINVLRIFPLQGVTIWGARTISHLTAWRYISTRRLFLLVEESIQEGTRWAVFEPNTPALWGKINRTVTDFLNRVWRDGALFGNTPEEAFYVKVDEELNPDPVRQLGQLIIEVGIRIAFPAEFIIFRIGQKVGGAEVTELA